jgi:predicted nucleic acid-binding protein
VIAADTNAIHDLFGAQSEPKTHLLRDAFREGRLLLPPPVLTEVLSEPDLPVFKGERVRALPLLEILDGYWERAGLLRGLILAERHKAFLADCLIAQSCLDHDIPLITYDLDFRHFIPAGLRLL